MRNKKNHQFFAHRLTELRCSRHADISVSPEYIPFHTMNLYLKITLVIPEIARPKML